MRSQADEDSTLSLGKNPKIRCSVNIKFVPIHISLVRPSCVGYTFPTTCNPFDAFVTTYSRGKGNAEGSRMLEHRRQGFQRLAATDRMF